MSNAMTTSVELLRRSSSNSHLPPTIRQRITPSADVFLEPLARGKHSIKRTQLAPDIGSPIIPPAINNLIAQAWRKFRNGAYEAAIEVMRAAAADVTRPRADRAMAAYEMGRMTHKTDGDNVVRTQLAWLTAKQLDPTLPGINKLKYKILSDNKQPELALEVVDEMLAADPNNIGLLKARAGLCLDLVKRPEGLRSAKSAIELAATAPIKPTKRDKVDMAYGAALYQNRNYPAAVAVYRQVLSRTPDHYGAHSQLAESVLPQLKGPRRPEVEALLQQANTAYQARNYGQVRRFAQRILAIDPNEGLGHWLWCVGYARSLEAAQAYANGSSGLIAAIDSDVKRSALLGQFTDLCSKAKVGVMQRHGKPSDLFPEWDILTDLQKSKVAHSILGYGKLIPDLIEWGAKYHLVLPGTSCSQVDPLTRPQERSGDGRYFYGIRGWQRDTFVVTGIESIDEAASGGYDTVCHEFAHLVHRYWDTDISARSASEQLAVRRMVSTIKELYDQAHAQKDGQRVLDDYSDTDEYEYFAQGAMAFLNTHGEGSENARRLYSRNPALWHFVRKITHDYQQFPQESPWVDHPKVGVEASGSPLTLATLAEQAKTSAVRNEAGTLLNRLIDVYIMVPDGAARARISQEIWARTEQLAQIDSGH